MQSGCIFLLGWMCLNGVNINIDSFLILLLVDCKDARDPAELVRLVSAHEAPRKGAVGFSLLQQGPP